MKLITGILICLLTGIFIGCGRSIYFEPGSVFSLSLHRSETKSAKLLIGRSNCSDAIQFQIENGSQIKDPTFNFQPNPVQTNEVILTVIASSQAPLGKSFVIVEALSSCSAGRYRTFFGLEILP